MELFGFDAKLSIYYWDANYERQYMKNVYKRIGYEPADLTVHPPPPRAGEGGFIFSYRCLVFPKNVLKGKPVLFGIIEVKRPKNVVFQHIHSNLILIVLTILDNNE